MARSENSSRRFVTEVAPAKLCSVAQRKAAEEKKSLDTIAEEESNSIDDLSASLESIPFPSHHWLQGGGERARLMQY